MIKTERVDSEKAALEAQEQIDSLYMPCEYCSEQVATFEPARMEHPCYRIAAKVLAKEQNKVEMKQEHTKDLGLVSQRDFQSSAQSEDQNPCSPETMSSNQKDITIEVIDLEDLPQETTSLVKKEPKKRGRKPKGTLVLKPECTVRTRSRSKAQEQENKAQISEEIPENTPATVDQEMEKPGTPPCKNIQLSGEKRKRTNDELNEDILRTAETVKGQKDFGVGMKKSRRNLAKEFAEID